MTATEIITNADKLRSKIGAIDKEVGNLLIELKNSPKIGGKEFPEEIANAMLAHRHLEDARMRLGKVIQSAEGGVSILDHPQVRALIAKIRADA